MLGRIIWVILVATLTIWTPATNADAYLTMETPILPVEWKEVVGRFTDLSRNRQIYEVNAYLNEKPYEAVIDDGVLVLQAVHKATCRDFASAKKYMLNALGVESSVVWAKVRDTGELHAYLLAAVTDGAVVGLDSRFEVPVSADILIKEYEPVYTVPKKYTFRIEDMLWKLDKK